MPTPQREIVQASSNLLRSIQQRDALVPDEMEYHSYLTVPDIKSTNHATYEGYGFDESQIAMAMRDDIKEEKKIRKR